MHLFLRERRLAPAEIGHDFCTMRKSLPGPKPRHAGQRIGVGGCPVHRAGLLLHNPPSALRLAIADLSAGPVQIMVEGLALGAFRTIHNMSAEPLLKNLLKYVIKDEARHVHYGVLALKDHFTRELSETERREREDWAFEVAVLMRNRFMAHEIFEEWFEGIISRQEWNRLISNSPAMMQFRQNMFSRLIPNLDFIGLMSERVRPHYARFGMLDYLKGKNASQLSEQDMIADLH